MYYLLCKYGLSVYVRHFHQRSDGTPKNIDSLIRLTVFVWFIAAERNIHIPTDGIFAPIENIYIEHFNTVSTAGYCNWRAVAILELGGCFCQFLNGYATLIHICTALYGDKSENACCTIG